MNTSITAHMIVKNEDQFIWYAICSVLPNVKKFIIYDTGSTDKTVSIIKTINSPKIVFKQLGSIDSKQLVALRNQQINETSTEWIWIVDGDEIYSTKTADSVVEATRNIHTIGIIVHRYDLLGDIYHSQTESVGSYQQFEKKGHYVLRLINKKLIPNLQVKGEYPNEYYTDKNGVSLKVRQREHFVFVEERIFHAMYLKRSSMGAVLFDTLHRNKWKIETGIPIATSELPEVFFTEKPEIVPCVTQKRSLFYSLSAMSITPLKKIKRILLKK